MGGAVLRREVQSAVKPAAVPGELKEGLVHFRRVFLDGDPEVGGEKLVSKHQFGNRELQVGIIPGHGGRLVLGAAAETARPRPTRVWGSRILGVLGKPAGAW